jgi:hypothetical protein
MDVCCVREPLAVLVAVLQQQWLSCKELIYDCKAGFRCMYASSA